jgi:hypothetical protein
MASDDDDSFYLILPSNTEVGNKTNSFRVQLPKLISLDGDWEVALVELIYPYSWDNVHQTPEDNEKIDFRPALMQIFPYDNPHFLTTVPRGHYDNISDLLHTINKTIRKAYIENASGITKANYIAPIKFRYNRNSKRVKIQIDKDICYAIQLNRHLRYLLGYDEEMMFGNKPELWVAKYPPDIRGGIDSIYIYCDLIERQIIGNTMEPLLRIVPIEGNYGDVVEKIFYYPHFLSILNKKFSSVELHIKTDQDLFLPFNYGKVTAKLHFRRKKKKQ